MRFFFPIFMLFGKRPTNMIDHRWLTYNGDAETNWAIVFGIVVVVVAVER